MMAEFEPGRYLTKERRVLYVDHRIKGSDRYEVLYQGWLWSMSASRLNQLGIRPAAAKSPA